MGPDCGTAYLNGVGVGFTNVAPRGRIGFVAAAGTGLQAVVSRVAALGEGVSHGIGVGGRDLSAEVGGMMTLFALEALADDPSTEAIVIISKPPHPTVLPRLEAAIAKIRKPVVACVLGVPPRRRCGDMGRYARRRRGCHCRAARQTGFGSGTFADTPGFARVWHASGERSDRDRGVRPVHGRDARARGASAARFSSGTRRCGTRSSIWATINTPWGGPTP